MTFLGSDVQPRERPVPCNLCGYRLYKGDMVPVTITWNTSGLCDKHEKDNVAAKRIEEIRNDFT